jgi:protein-S-isoprenylcysteine O-methyltransferase Ste14
MGQFQNRGTMEDEKDSPGVIAMPPVIVGAFLIAGLVLEYLFSWPQLAQSAQYIAGGVLIAASGLLMPGILLRFRRAGTHLDVRKSTSAIITDGPYRVSRNPIYVSLMLLYFGIGLMVDGVWIIILAAPLAMVIHHGVILREERYLEKKFGEEYLTYKRAVRRWI